MINYNRKTAVNNHTRSIPALLVMGTICFLAILCLSLINGAADIPFSTVMEAFCAFDKNNPHHLMVIDLRLPRTLISALVGATLSVAGAIMQGTTRNPMADSGIMGINAGAGFAIAICFAFFPGITYGGLVLSAFLGAATGALLISSVSFSQIGGTAPMRMVLAGAAVSSLLAALSQGIALSFEVGVDILFWTVGGVANVTWPQFYLLAPVISIALIAAILLSPSISILNLGYDIAKGLGLNTTLIQLQCMVVVLTLAGVSVSAVGSVSFVGLIIPHFARFLLGVDYRKIIPASGVLGALLLMLADLCARTITPPFEVPLGVITSLIGVPFFLYLSRKTRRGF